MKTYAVPKTTKYEYKISACSPQPILLTRDVFDQIDQVPVSESTRVVYVDTRQLVVGLHVVHADSPLLS